MNSHTITRHITFSAFFEDNYDHHWVYWLADLSGAMTAGMIQSQFLSPNVGKKEVEQKEVESVKKVRYEGDEV